MVLMGDGKRQKMATDTKLINIKPGMGTGSTLVFKGEGHKRAGQTPSDLVIEFELIPHSKFKRFQNDLIIEHQISLMDAINAGPVKFKTLEGEQIEISVEEITPDTFKIIEGKGMPIVNDNPLGPIMKDSGRGNLILKFDIQFPTNLDETKKNKLVALLDEIEEENQV
jgi:DnaJ-class molecular chaperone